MQGEYLDAKGDVLYAPFPPSLNEVKRVAGNLNKLSNFLKKKVEQLSKIETGSS